MVQGVEFIDQLLCMDGPFLLNLQNLRHGISHREVEGPSSHHLQGHSGGCCGHHREGDRPGRARRHQHLLGQPSAPSQAQPLHWGHVDAHSQVSSQVVIEDRPQLQLLKAADRHGQAEVQVELAEHPQLDWGGHT